jgi:hypothetical protein
VPEVLLMDAMGPVEHEIKGYPIRVMLAITDGYTGQIKYKIHLFNPHNVRVSMIEGYLSVLTNSQKVFSLPIRHVVGIWKLKVIFVKDDTSQEEIHEIQLPDQILV